MIGIDLYGPAVTQDSLAARRATWGGSTQTAARGLPRGSQSHEHRRFYKGCRASSGCGINVTRRAGAASRLDEPTRTLGFRELGIAKDHFRLVGAPLAARGS
jgi:hypothetical protein